MATLMASKTLATTAPKVPLTKNAMQAVVVLTVIVRALGAEFAVSLAVAVAVAVAAHALEAAPDVVVHAAVAGDS